MQHPKRSLLFNTLPLCLGVNFLLTLFSWITPYRAKAQIPPEIIPDGTLGDKSSVVVGDQLYGSPINRINGGAIQGNNLFHSFKEFNVVEKGAYFTNPGGITNILTRVTGGNASNILGTLGVLGRANLFFINPNGIIFGPNAHLDMGGSFVASTANSLVFDNGLEFSATNPLSPPLLTVNIPVGLRLRENPASIIVKKSSDINHALYLPAGNTLALVGGNVILDGGKLQIPGGRIELGGLTSAGTVGLNIQESQGIPRVASLSFPNGVERSDVSLSEQAVVNVQGKHGGSIAINGRNLNIVRGGRLLAGIDPRFDSPETQAGNIEINATDQVVFSGASSGALNQVEAGGQGNSGDINIKARSLEVSDGAQLSASTSGKGNSGTIRVTATDKAVIDGQPSSLFSQVGENAEGNSGGIEISAGSVEITKGGLLDTNTLGRGNSGKIRITATGQAVFEGESPYNFLSKVHSEVQNGAVGNSGGIEINAGSVDITKGAELSAGTSGQGDAGKISITARDRLLVDGESEKNFLSKVFSQVEKDAVGNSGGIEINADSVDITKGAELSAGTSGQGDAGKISITTRDRLLVDGESIYNYRSAVFSQVEKDAVGNSGGIEINAGSVAITKGAQLSASTSGQKGDAGKISITARDRLLVDGESIYNYRSAVFSQVEKDAVGNSGGIEIDAGSVDITKGAQLSASTSGEGDAGKISITARDQVLVGGESILSQVEKGAVGNSGGIEIDAGSVAITKGAQLSASTSGQGDAGKISITARDQVLVDNEPIYNSLSKVFSQVEKGAVGNSGGIEIDAGSVAITKGAQLSASTSGRQGNAGKISITARDQVLVDGESILSQVEKGTVGNSGGIEIDAGSVAIINGAQLSATTSGEGDAGKISITATHKVMFDGESNGGSRTAALSQVFDGAIGKSDGIVIKTPILEVTNGAFLDASTKSSGDAGMISITATDKVIFDGESKGGSRTAALSQVFDGAIGKSDGIVIKTPILEVTNGAFLDASTKSSGDAGMISITATDKVIFDGQSSQGNGSAATSQVTNTGTGKSGGIEINAPNVRITNGAELNTTTLGKGNSGAIRVTATDSVVVDGTSDRSLPSAIASEVGTGATGASQGITINTPHLQVSNQAFISASTNGNGDAGNIDITSDTIKLSSAGQIRTNTSASSKAGDITLNAQNRITISDLGTAVLAQTEKTSTSAGGNIFVIGSPKNVLIQNGAELSVNSKGSGTGGDIFLQGNSLTLNQGTISAETAKEKGGNINLEVADLLLMQGDSKITTNAGIESQAGAIGTGGDIAINTQFLVAPPSKPKGSDITANATYGDGGRVDVTATGIFGIEFRDKPRDLLNDITASSEFGGNPGVVNINQGIDPSRNLVELPATVVDPNDQIAQNPCSKGVGSEFTITGRGGLPPSPNEDLSQEATQVGLVEPVSTVSNVKPTQKTSFSHNSPSQIPSPIVPAQGWVFNNKGEVILTAYNPKVTEIHRLPKNLSSCPAR